jgi:aminodeoxyfutalosine synthase
MFDQSYYAALGLGDAYVKVMQNSRLSADDGEALFACPNILAVGALAHHARIRRHGSKTYYVRNRHINYSNVCVNHCRFCAFRRDEASAPGAFVLDKQDIVDRALDDQGFPFAEIHVVGGCHPSLSLSWFEDLFRTLKELRPDAILKAFTVVEIHHFARMESCTESAVLERLKASGLAMLTGGGAEIFNPSVRQRICPEKISGQDYLRIAGEAHRIGIASNCSMLFGHVESYQDRVEHLCALREQQDRSGGFVCFIPLPFQARHNLLAEELVQTPAATEALATGLDRLRTIAVARLLLDNIPHIKAYWVMLGIKTAQAALTFGADDLDGTIIEEHIGHMAGADSAQAVTREELEAMIKGCGFIPVKRDALFNDLFVQGAVSAISVQDAVSATSVQGRGSV